ncbi:hypothetical protein C8J57DRAFT_1095429, partial [Mycena rebaudengoi]
ATWYTPNGGVGACGAPLQNSDFIVALSEAHYDGGGHCWQHLDVEYNGQHIDVTVGDLCPGCTTDGLDLSEGALLPSRISTREESLWRGASSNFREGRQCTVTFE